MRTVPRGKEIVRQVDWVYALFVRKMENVISKVTYSYSTCQMYINNGSIIYGYQSFLQKV